MKTENFVQVIVSLVITAIFGAILNMGIWSVFPSVLLAVVWGGINQTSSSDNDKSIWKDVVCIVGSAIVMTAIVVIGA